MCAYYAASFTDSGPVAYSKPRRSKKTKPAALPRTMSSNPIYEGHGPVYEATPGEAINPLISPISSIPSTPADVTPRYFGMPPTLPPPRNGSVAMIPTLETVDEIINEVTPSEALNPLISPISSIPSTPADVTPRYFDKPPTLPPPRNGSVAMLPTLETVDEIDAIKAAIKDSELPQTGDEYMVMNGAKLDGTTDLHDADKNNAEEMYTMMK